MKIIISGSEGFIGRKLVAHCLENNMNVLGISTKQSHITQCKTIQTYDPDLRNKIISFEPDCFINLAWHGASGPNRNNIEIQMKNLKECFEYYDLANKANCKKFIGIGTISELVAESKYQESVISNNQIYGLTKSFCNKVLQSISTNNTCKSIWCRLGNIYGPGDKTGNLISYTINSLMNNEKPSFGSCDQPFDFVHINDCVDALYKAIISDTTDCKTLYIGSGFPKILKEFIQTISTIIDNDVPIGIGERPDDGTRYSWDWFDISKTKDEIGYEPKISFENGIRQILRTDYGIDSNV